LVRRLDQRDRVVIAIYQPARLDQTLHFDRSIAGLGPQIAAEIHLGIKLQERHPPFTAIFDHQGPVVGQQFREQRQPEQHAKDP
jgi:hypothetical protein